MFSLLLSLTCLGCASAEESNGPDVGPSTTLGAPFEGEYRAEEMGFNRVHLPILLGMTPDEATDEALDRGWVTVVVIDLDSDEPQFGGGALRPSELVTIWLQSGVVTDAWAG